MKYIYILAIAFQLLLLGAILFVVSRVDVCSSYLPIEGDYATYNDMLEDLNK